MSNPLPERFTISASVRTRALDDELILLDLDHGEYFSLNSAGAQIWKALEAGQGLDWIRREVVALWPVPLQEGIDMMTSVLDALLQRGLIVRAP